MGTQNWTQATDFSGHLQQSEKRLGMEERRPRINKASDVLGPLFAPSAVLLEDSLDSPLLGFNGLFIVRPGTIESPDPLKWWIGQSIAQDGVGGVQILYTFQPADAPHQAKMRGWETVVGSGGLRAYSAWQDVGGATVPTQRIEIASDDSVVIAAGDLYQDEIITFPNGPFPSPPEVLVGQIHSSALHAPTVFLLRSSVTVSGCTIRCMRYEGSSTTSPITSGYTYMASLAT